MKLYLVVNELSNKAISPIIQAENDGVALLGFKSFMEKGELDKVGITPDIVTLYGLGDIDDDSHVITAEIIGCRVVADGNNYQEQLDECIKNLRLQEE